jgi:peptide/nickel transport system permease protein
MTTLIHGGSVERAALRRWRTRLAHFGFTGWLGLAVIVFWAAASVFGPALMSQRGDAGGATCSHPSAPHIGSVPTTWAATCWRG